MVEKREYRPVATVARRLGVSTRQVRRLIASGDLRAKRMNPKSHRPTWLVYWNDVERYDELRNPGATA